MRKAQRQEILNFIDSLHQAHEEIREALRQENYAQAQNMLSECQEFAVTLGENIEQLEGEGHVTVSFVEEYCETLFHVFQELQDHSVNENKEYKILRKQLLKVENSVKSDIRIRKEIVFFPYKASMWDSLESVYLAAKEDPDCDAYCVPIPYYDLNPDHSFGKMHYEGRNYPANIEIIDWVTYNLEERKPDVIYIHNPYDDTNQVTSVLPRYYSFNLKQYTDTLVYIPYYSTLGGMNEAQGLCSAYLYADYIVIQSPKYREYFDKGLPDRKFLPFGSPKFDRVIRKCQNPPQPPVEWKEKMAGKKVYFYNTSISGMLTDTENFLKKMHYVFQCFEGREDACLLWRPHPLLEATFDSMRPQYRLLYDALKSLFIELEQGIYDATPDVTDTIALCDAYIGDDKTSVTSLFGLAGKPLFILNDRIHEEPWEDSWREEIELNINFLENGRFVITQGNKLYVSEPDAYKYKYYCDLAEYSLSRQYSLVYEIEGKLYACPENTMDIVVVGKEGIEKKIELDKRIKNKRAFSWAWKYDKYLLLIPSNYPAIVRYDTTTGQIRYFEDSIDVFVKNIDGRNVVGGSLVYQGSLFIASPVDNLIYKLHIESGQIQVIELPIQSRCGGFQLAEYRNEIWLMPYEGKEIVRWNPLTGETREYTEFPEDFSCVNADSGREGAVFNIPAFYGEYIYLTPCNSNMCLKMNIETGECIKWLPPLKNEQVDFSVVEGSTFLWHMPHEEEFDFKLYSYSEKKIFRINIAENTCQEADIQFDVEEIKRHEAGFCACSPALRYACIENAFNSLGRFLDGEITGGQFDRQKQLAAYSEITVNYDGSCGRKVHEYINGQI